MLKPCKFYYIIFSDIALLSDTLCVCVSILVDLQEDIEAIDRFIAHGEAEYNKWRHPDPYIGN